MCIKQGLMTEGVEVTSLPSNYLLPAGSHNVQTKLQLVPRAGGQLTVTGTTYACGIT